MNNRFLTNQSKKEYFTEIYKQNFNYIYSFVFSRTAGDGQMTEEIVQETFSAAWASLERYEGKSTYGTWLCSIAKNKLFEQYRKRTVTNKLIVDDIDLVTEQASNFDLEWAVLDRDSRTQVLNALNGIRDIYRYALIMKYIDDISVKKMAEVLGRTPKAVDGILQRAKRCFAREYLKSVEREMEHG